MIDKDYSHMNCVICTEIIGDERSFHYLESTGKTMYYAGMSVHAACLGGMAKVKVLDDLNRAAANFNLLMTKGLS